MPGEPDRREESIAERVGRLLDEMRRRKREREGAAAPRRPVPKHWQEAAEDRDEEGDGCDAP